MEGFNEFLTSPLGLVLAGVAAFVIGSMFFNVKQWEAHWKQWAIDTSKAMSKAGLVHTPKALDALAVGDLAGAFKEVKTLGDVFKDPKQLAAEFSTVFQNMLDAAFKDPTQAKALLQLANDAVGAFASGDPAKASGQLAADAQAAFGAGPLSQIALPPSLLASLAPAALATGNPVVAAIVQTLQTANLGHLAPLVIAGAQAQQSQAAAQSGQPAPSNAATSSSAGGPALPKAA